VTSCQKVNQCFWTSGLSIGSHFVPSIRTDKLSGKEKLPFLRKLIVYFFFLILKGGEIGVKFLRYETTPHHQWNRPSIKFLFKLGRNLGDILIKIIWIVTTEVAGILNIVCALVA